MEERNLYLNMAYLVSMKIKRSLYTGTYSLLYPVSLLRSLMLIKKKLNIKTLYSWGNLTLI